MLLQVEGRPTGPSTVMVWYRCSGTQTRAKVQGVLTLPQVPLCALCGWRVGSSQETCAAGIIATPFLQIKNRGTK